MSVYLDELGHLATDGPAEELHELAARAGLKREWYQDQGHAARHPHYDVIGPWKRKQCIAAGAVEVGSKDLIQMMKAGGVWK